MRITPENVHELVGQYVVIDVDGTMVEGILGRVQKADGTFTLVGRGCTEYVLDANTVHSSRAYDDEPVVIRTLPSDDPQVAAVCEELVAFIAKYADVSELVITPSIVYRDQLDDVRKPLYKLIYTAYGDYVTGSAIGYSNSQFLEENYAVGMALDGWTNRYSVDEWPVGTEVLPHHGGWNHQQLWTTDIVLAYYWTKKRDSYPLADEDGHSEVEMEWRELACTQFVKENLREFQGDGKYYPMCVEVTKEMLEHVVADWLWNNGRSAGYRTWDYSESDLITVLTSDVDWKAISEMVL